jgi:hypothetical protein
MGRYGIRSWYCGGLFKELMKYEYELWKKDKQIGVLKLTSEILFCRWFIFLYVTNSGYKEVKVSIDTRRLNYQDHRMILDVSKNTKKQIQALLDHGKSADA